MFSAVGPERRCRAMRSSSRSTRPVLRSRKVRRPSSPWSAASKTLLSDALVMARPPSPATTVATGIGKPLSVMATSVDSTPPKPTLMAFSTTTTCRHVLECAPNGIDRERPERGDAHRTDPVPGGALRVHDFLDRPEDRAHGHDHHFGVGTPVRVHEAARVAPEGLGEFRAQPSDAVQRRELAGVRQVPHLLERLGAHHGADGVRLCRVEHLAGLVGGQERVHLLLAREGPPARWHG